MSKEIEWQMKNKQKSAGLLRGFRYIDGLLLLYDGKAAYNPATVVAEIYPSTLPLNETIYSNKHTAFLDMDINLATKTWKLYDKRLAFPFECIVATHFSSNFSRAVKTGSFFGHWLRCMRICRDFSGLKESVLLIIKGFKRNEYNKGILLEIALNCTNAHRNEFSKYNMPFNCLVMRTFKEWIDKA